MSITYESVFDAFTSKISDDIFVSLPDIDAEDQMIQMLDDGLIYFKYPKVNVYNKDNVLKIFNVDLSYFEIQIIANLMVYAWINRQVKSMKLIKQKFTDRDFKITSQAAHLEVLLKLKKDQLSECQQLMKDYYKTNSNRPDYSKLAGDIS